MIATCVIEVGLALYTLWRYELNKLTRLVVVLLALLAVFQLAEFQVCTGHESAVIWSRVGYIAITLLPPIGIQIVSTLRFGHGRKNVVYAAFAAAAAFILYFVAIPQSIEGQRCLGNYVFFQVNPHLTPLYGFYYYGWVLVGAFLALRHSRSVRELRRRQALYGFTVGYAAFLIPTVTVNVINPATTNGIPSIMCGFAVILALIAALYVMPRGGTKKVPFVPEQKAS